MPRAGTSVKFIQQCEDDMAVLLTARDQLETLQLIAVLLHKNGRITQSTYHDIRDGCDYIVRALAIARRNTGRLRREGTP